MNYETLRYEVDADKVATVTIHRPEAMNAFNGPMLREFHALWPSIQADDAVNAVVLRAAAGRAFSTGADVKAAQSDPYLDFTKPVEMRDPGEFLGPKANRCWKPVIGAIHGLCCAGAFYWVNECDILIASDDAQFFDPHVSYGLVAAVEPIGLTYRMPYGDVMRMALLGNDERVSAHTALRIGLVSEVIDGTDALWTRAHDLAAKIATKPTTAVQGTVRAIWESQDLPRGAALLAGFKTPLFANPIGQAQLDHQALMRGGKKFEVR